MYEWDEDKDRVNREKHGLSLSLAADFGWSSAIIQVDSRFDYGEERSRAFGFVGDLAICIAFTTRDFNVRIISLRRMHEKELRRYGLAKKI